MYADQELLDYIRSSFTTCTINAKVCKEAKRESTASYWKGSANVYENLLIILETASKYK